MGLLVDGKWQDKWYDTKSTKGHFIRSASQFRNWVTKDGEKGPSGRGGFKAEANRYHLYVSLACPWASRALMMRALKGLEDIISVSIVHPLMLEHGWTFDPSSSGVKDHLFDLNYLYELYLKADPDYTGRVTVPVLWDKKTQTIVSNESSEIIRMFNSAFEVFQDNDYDYYPDALADDIDAMNDFVYPNINNGVYKTGFATTQKVYEKEVDNLFKALDKVEALLEKQDYLVGNTFTEADIRLFTTLVRFDSVYFGHFKCNLKPLTDYKNLWVYTKGIYNMPKIADTVNFEHIKEHYYGSHKTINPNGIVPKGPNLDWSL
ncbi:glutathione S-transferase family protein [Streptococcus catagoni]|uniref:glutathione S-transferase family protein n=1 Tax=Streptococcus catagoni TaxID=2654874 RepID=UPI00140C21C4|nr:glutathione S-transferase family protein [Streptococcus catagoni]